MLAWLFLKCLSVALAYCYRLLLTNDYILMTRRQLLFSDTTRRQLRLSLRKQRYCQEMKTLKFMDSLPAPSHVAPLFKVNHRSSIFLVFVYNQLCDAKVVLLIRHSHSWLLFPEYDLEIRMKYNAISNLKGVRYRILALLQNVAIEALLCV